MNQSSNGSFTIPNSAPFTSSPTFFADMRFSGVALPSVCNASMFGSGTFQSSGFGIRICNPENRGTGAFQLWGTGTGLPGGPDAEMMPPNQSIIAITGSATAPEIFFSSAPFPIAFQVGQQVLINGGTGGAGNLPGNCANLEGLQTITAVHPTSIVVSGECYRRALMRQVQVAISNDWRARIQWDNAGGNLRQEVWNVDGTGYNINTVAIPTGELTATYPQTLSNGDATMNVAFYRMCSGIIAAGSPPPQDAPTGSVCPAGTVMINWDPSSHTGSGGSIAIPDPANGITLSVPNATFVTTPVYNPGCVPGPAQSVALGNTLTLNGSGSVPLNNNNTLTCHWDAIASSEPGQLPNQTGLTWPSGQNICNPPVSGFLQGPANFQLTVKDSALNTSVCTVHDGATQVDGAGMVVPQTDATGSLAKIYRLVGPLKQWGNNPTWPAVDAFHMTWANTLGPQQGFTIPGQVGPGVWVDTWNTAGPGTVSMTNGTNTVTGVGTDFTTRFCQGATGSPTVAQDQMDFILWAPYPITGGGGGTTRSYNPVTGCTNDNLLTVQFNWSNPTIGPSPGAQYSTYDKFTQASWMSTAGVSNINFYDNVLMYISLWLRTGIDSYLHYARWLAQRFWTVRRWAARQTNGCVSSGNCSNTPIVPRNTSLQGVVVEALYQDYVAGSAGASGIWAGLEELELTVGNSG